MTNVNCKVEGTKLTIEIDLSQTHGKSESGKSEKVATTSGNVDVPGCPGLKIGINCYKPVK